MSSCDFCKSLVPFGIQALINESKEVKAINSLQNWSPTLFELSKYLYTMGGITWRMEIFYKQIKHIEIEIKNSYLLIFLICFISIE